jgi:hypothetical protein
MAGTARGQNIIPTILERLRTEYAPGRITSRRISLDVGIDEERVRSSLNNYVRTHGDHGVAGITRLTPGQYELTTELWTIANLAIPTSVYDRPGYTLNDPADEPVDPTKNSILQSGGWCAPSQDELGFPEVSVNRGGIKFGDVITCSIKIVKRQENLLILEDDDSVLWAARRI